MAACTSADSILETMALIKVNGTKIDMFTNGTAAQTVQLGTGAPTPCLRKFLAGIQQNVVAVVNLRITDAMIDDLFI